MDKDLARIIATAGLQAMRELEGIYSIVSHHPPENEQLKHGIASAIAEVGLTILRPAFDAAPELESEFDARIERYGRAT